MHEAEDPWPDTVFPRLTLALTVQEVRADQGEQLKRWSCDHSLEEDSRDRSPEKWPEPKEFP